MDIRLARDLGMSDRVQRLSVGHMGCYAALPGLGTAADYVAVRGRPALLLCAELTSLHVQPPSTDPQQMVAHALFSDAAAAAVIVPGGPGFAVTDVASVTDATTADQMTWDVTDLGFRMGLSNKVPDILAGHVVPLVTGLLDRHGLSVSDVDGWAVHPGGPRILDVVQRELGLGPAELGPSRAQLAEHGNSSSPTVLLILETLARAGIMTVTAGSRPATVLALAFGPGLTLYGALLAATAR